MTNFRSRARRATVAATIAALAAFALTSCTPTPGGDAIASYLQGQWQCQTHGGYEFGASFGDGKGTYTTHGNGSFTLSLSTSGDQLLIQNNAGQSFVITAKNGVPVGQTGMFEYSEAGDAPQEVSAAIDGDSRVMFGQPSTDTKTWTVCTKS